MKNLMSYYKNKRGMGILEAMIMLSIGLLILTAINQLFKKMADGAEYYLKHSCFNVNVSRFNILI